MAVDTGAVAPLPRNGGAQGAGGMSAAGQTNTPRQAFDDPDGPSFSDLLDVLNPLQHIPLVNCVYRDLTGDKEGVMADLVGGALWGGWIGLGAAMGDLVFEDATGKSVGDTVIGLFKDDNPTTAVAQDSQTSAPAAQAAVAQAAVAQATATTTATTTATAASPAVPVGAQTAMDAAADGPVVAGNYLVFGGQAANRPLSLLPAASADQPAKRDTAPSAGSAPAPRQMGGFLVFGADQPAAASLPAASDPVVAPQAAAAVPAQASQTSQAVEAAPMQTAAAAQPIQQPAASGAGRAWPVPPRRGPATPPQTLPMPTTGPAAVPGNGRSSAAIHAAVQAPPFGGEAFADAFNHAMDKYQKAAALVPQPAAQ